jgi:hypothetical protein
MGVKRFLVVPLLFVLSCKPPTPTEQMDDIVSWVGTAGMLGDAWLRHTTPDKYTRQTLELSDQFLLQIGSDLKSRLPPAVDSAVLDSAITRSRFHIAQMARLVEEKNAPDFTKQLDSLRMYQRLVKQLSDSIESSQ